MWYSIPDGADIPSELYEAEEAASGPVKEGASESDHFADGDARDVESAEASDAQKDGSPTREETPEDSPEEEDAASEDSRPDGPVGDGSAAEPIWQVLSIPEDASDANDDESEREGGVEGANESTSDGTDASGGARHATGLAGKHEGGAVVEPSPEFQSACTFMGAAFLIAIAGAMFAAHR